MSTCTESEALQEQDGDIMAADDEAERRAAEYENRIQKMKERYDDNARSNVRTTIRCACCGKRIIKRNYQTQFCRNKGAGNCKDTYWNNVSVSRRKRAKFFA